MCCVWDVGLLYGDPGRIRGSACAARGTEPKNAHKSLFAAGSEGGKRRFLVLWMSTLSMDLAWIAMQTPLDS